MTVMGSLRTTSSLLDDTEGALRRGAKRSAARGKGESALLLGDMLLLVVGRPRIRERRVVMDGDRDREVGEALGDGVTSMSPAAVGLHGESISWIEEEAVPSKVELEVALCSITIGLVLDVWGKSERLALSDARIGNSWADLVFFPGRQKNPEGDVGLDKGGEGGRI